jgi:hypothetical protein
VRFIERALVLCVAVCGIVYSERVVRMTLSTVTRIDPSHLHGVEITGSALGVIQAGIAAAVILFAVVPAILSVFDGRKLPAALVIGELVAALLLFGVSERVLHDSVHAHIVSRGDGRVLAVRASATEAVE